MMWRQPLKFLERSGASLEDFSSEVVPAFDIFGVKWRQPLQLLDRSGACLGERYREISSAFEVAGAK